MRLSSIFTSSLAIFFAIGCGTIRSEEETTPDAMPVDITPPSIQALSPVLDAESVGPNQRIVIEFTEAMDRASVEGAWQSTQLPAEDVIFSWNAQGTELTAEPIQGLPLAEGIGLDLTNVTPLTITIFLGRTATDIAGNGFESDPQLRFQTMRRMRVTLNHVPSLTFIILEEGNSPANSENILCGDNTGNKQFKSFMTFNLPNFPTGAAMETVVLKASQGGSEGGPFGSGSLGEIHLFRVSANIFDIAAFSSSPLSDVGVLSDNVTPGMRSADVTTEFRDALANQAGRIFFRMEFTKATNSNLGQDFTIFIKASLALDISYLVPSESAGRPEFPLSNNRQFSLEFTSQ